MVVEGVLSWLGGYREKAVLPFLSFLHSLFFFMDFSIVEKVFHLRIEMES